MANSPGKTSTTFFQKFIRSELGTRILPYVRNGAATDGTVSSTLVILQTNLNLPSTEPFLQHRFNGGIRARMEMTNSGLINSTRALLRNLSLGQWISGLGIIPIINMTQIIATTLLEAGLRSLGASLMLPMYRLNNSRTGTIGKVAGNFFLSPLFMIAQTLTLVADVCSYTRQFLDSAFYFFNPLWWACKAIDTTRFKTETPSMGIVAKTLLTSTLRLLPAALLVTAAVLTAGVSTPILQGIAGPLSTFGSLVASTFTASAATVALGASIAVYAGGAVAIASKFFSFCAKTVLMKPSSKKTIVKIKAEAPAPAKTPLSGNSNNQMNAQLKTAKESKRAADEIRRTIDDGDHDKPEEETLIQQTKAEADVSQTPEPEIYRRRSNTI